MNFSKCCNAVVRVNISESWCSNCGKPCTEQEPADLEKQMKEMMDDPRTGLRDSSDTNKTRYGLLALLEEARKEGFSEGQKYALGLDEEIVRQDERKKEVIL